jgi:type I site-specific restriction endonuclease
MPNFELTDSDTRPILIDPLPEKAGRVLGNRTQVNPEIPVDGYCAELWNGVTEYCHEHSDDTVLAMTESKKCSRVPRVADEQLRRSGTEIIKKQPYFPFGFIANGREIWFCEIGEANSRLIAGFFSRDDLKRLLYLRQHGHRHGQDAHHVDTDPRLPPHQPSRSPPPIRAPLPIPHPPRLLRTTIAHRRCC